MDASRSFLHRAGPSVLIVILVAASAVAQTPARVRVTTERATIWRPGFTTMATVVNVGTVLEVVARQGDWYEVVLPALGGTTGGTGMIAISQVVLMPGSPIPAEVPGQAPAAQDIEPLEPAPSFAVRAFGSFGYDWASAHKAFSAVLGQSGGVIFGAGGQVRLQDRFILEVSVERFRKTGERVFVSDSGEVSRLGIPDTITITPLAFTVGYRFSGSHVPYFGGGAGRYFYKEESAFADPSENVDQQFTSYHVRGGYEWQSGLLATAFELQYTHVPSALSGGAAAAFNEHNLGGVQARVKVLFGK